MTLEGAVGTGKISPEQIRIYPDPATENIFIEFTGKADILMQDPLGRFCYHMNNVQGDFTLNISEFKKGVYILSRYFEDGRLLQRKVMFQ